MKKQSQNAIIKRLAKLNNILKPKCPQCGQILKKSAISIKNKKGKIVPMKICPNCDYKA